MSRFSERPAAYAAHRPGYPAALARFLAGAAPRRDLAWDAGCGSGQLSVRLAERFGRVVATDASAEQLAHAIPHPHVEYRRARAGASGLPEGVVDLAAAAQAAHWFDLPAYYAEVRRAARPGALVALVTYGLPAVDATVDPAIGRFSAEVLGPHWPAERGAVDDAYRSLPFPFQELDAPPFEIRERRTLGDFLGYVATWSAARALERAEGPEPMRAFARRLERAWGPGTVRVVRWPLALRVGRV